MSGKLVRNTSTARWRAYWEAVDAAAATAPTLGGRERAVDRAERERPADERRRKAKKQR